MRHYIADYAAAVDPVQAAINAASSGDSIYFSPVNGPLVAPVGGWRIEKSLELFGDGPGPVGAALASALRPQDTSSPIFDIIPPASNVYIHDLQLVGIDDAELQPAGVGVRCRSTALNPAKSSNLILRNLQIQGFAGYGVYLEGYITTGTSPIESPVDGLTLCDCRIRNCHGAGVYLNNVYEAHIASSVFENNKLQGMRIESSRAALYACTFDSNCSESVNPNDGNLMFIDCPIARVDASRFLNFAAVGTAKKALIIQGGAAIVGTCYFVAHSSTNGGQGIGILASAKPGAARPGPIVILGNRFRYTTTLINIVSTAVDCTVLPQYSETTGGSITLPSALTGTLAAPHIIRPGSGSSLTGLIVPSYSTDPVKSTTDGMIAYNTTLNALRVRVDGQWKSVTTVP